MKKLKFLIILILFSNCSSSLKYLNAFHGYNGNPIEVKSYAYDSELENSNEKGIYTITFYDSKGRNYKSKSFFSDGAPTDGGHYYHTYDKYGNKIQFISRLKDSIVLVEVNFKYNKNGQEIEKTHIRDNKKTITKTTYDDEKRTATIISKRFDGSIKEHSIKIFDKKSQLVKILRVDLEGNTSPGTESVFDKNGNRIKFTYHSKDKDSRRVTETSYNNKNEMTLVKAYNIKNKDTFNISIKNYRYEYQFDDCNNKTKIILHKNEESSWIRCYEYKYVR